MLSKVSTHLLRHSSCQYRVYSHLYVRNKHVSKYLHPIAIQHYLCPYNSSKKKYSTESLASFVHYDNNTSEEINAIQRIFKQKNIDTRLKELQKEADRIDLWEDTKYATTIMQEFAVLNTQKTEIDDIKSQVADVKILYELAKEEKDEEMLLECLQTMKSLFHIAKEQRMKLLLSDSIDQISCFIEILAGAGGTDACDWVAMLARMYTEWGIHRSYNVNYVSQVSGEEVGFRSVCLKLEGPHAYGWCKTEAGVHRLVRISPFDSASRRHTSFAQVRVYPASVDLLNSDALGLKEIPSKDIRIDTYKSSGPGGQHANTTDSAIRLTHLPTGVIVTCQSERSQHRNKAMAMEILQSKLLQREIDTKTQQRHNYTKGLGENEWGSQIRSYILQPYELIKDHRTNYSVTDVSSVLNGMLDPFMSEALLQEYTDDNA